MMPPEVETEQLPCRRSIPLAEREFSPKDFLEREYFPDARENIPWSGDVTSLIPGASARRDWASRHLPLRPSPCDFWPMRTIRRCSSRKLHDTQTSHYVTLAQEPMPNSVAGKVGITKDKAAAIGRPEMRAQAQLPLIGRRRCLLRRAGCREHRRSGWPWRALALP